MIARQTCLGSTRRYHFFNEAASGCFPRDRLFILLSGVFSRDCFFALLSRFLLRGIEILLRGISDAPGAVWARAHRAPPPTPHGLPCLVSAWPGSAWPCMTWLGVPWLAWLPKGHPDYRLALEDKRRFRSRLPIRIRSGEEPITIAEHCAPDYRLRLA